MLLGAQEGATPSLTIVHAEIATDDCGQKYINKYSQLIGTISTTNNFIVDEETHFKLIKNRGTETALEFTEEKMRQLCKGIRFPSPTKALTFGSLSFFQEERGEEASSAYGSPPKMTNEKPPTPPL
ncbi:MAG: hypothetical protein K0U37_02985 [Gammaproteobacteria bacterium]|nr:hypothetical protein [Gammaproteobacteria bacterium]